MRPAIGGKKVRIKKSHPLLNWSFFILLMGSLSAGIYFWIKSPSSDWKSLLTDNKLTQLVRSFDAGRLLPQPANKPPEGSIACQGIIRGQNGQPAAVVNDQTVEIGSVINGMKIIEIAASNIRLEYRGKPISLRPGEHFTPDP